MLLAWVRLRYMLIDRPIVRTLTIVRQDAARMTYYEWIRLSKNLSLGTDSAYHTS